MSPPQWSDGRLARRRGEAAIPSTPTIESTTHRRPEKCPLKSRSYQGAPSGVVQPHHKRGFNRLRHFLHYTCIFEMPSEFQPSASHDVSLIRIRSLKPNVTREEAVLQFCSTGIPRLFRNVAFGPLRSVAELYLPFRLFQVQIFNRGTRDEKLIAIDSLSGTLDPFHFDHVPAEAETVSVDTRNCPRTQLNEAALNELLIAKLRRLLYTRGFFRMRDLEIRAAPIPCDLHIPYWLGFRGSNGNARVAVIDAVRRRFEGAKVRRLIETWLTTNS